ncbi:hypothetical protein H5410_055170 [Solanum commersonii]|uniref:Uncharacterized protein n=1 Tax=Solanum commersonii TaxID=4109 RepID=A0A9J5WIJ8_SOLCO|nr:hypothetical protein H5410_055170 [Solanum commersonii]
MSELCPLEVGQLAGKVRVRAWEVREKEEKKKRRKGRSSKEIVVIFVEFIPGNLRSTKRLSLC